MLASRQHRRCPCPGDFGTSRWQLFGKITPTAGAPERGRPTIFFAAREAGSGPTLPTLAVQQDGSYLGCTGNRLTYGPARRRIGSDNGRSRIPNPALNTTA